MAHEIRYRHITFAWCSHVDMDDVLFALKLHKALMRAGAAGVYDDDKQWTQEWIAAANHSDVVVMIASDKDSASEWSAREAKLLAKIKTAPVLRIQRGNGVEDAIRCIDDCFRGIPAGTNLSPARRTCNMRTFQKTENGYVRTKDTAAFNEVEKCLKLTR